MTMTATRMMPVSELEEWELNPRRGIYRGMESLRDSIAAEGIKDALHVWVTQGRTVVLQGNRRLRCARDLGLAEVPVIVESCADEAAALKLLMVLQLEHDGFDPLEESVGLESLVRMGLSAGEVAEAVNRSEHWVQLRLDALKLPDNGKEAYGRGVLDLGSVGLLMRLDDAEERRQAVEAVLRPEFEDQPLVGMAAHRAIEQGWIERAEARRAWAEGLRGMQRKFPRSKGYVVLENFSEFETYCSRMGHPVAPWRHGDEGIDRRELVDAALVMTWGDLARKHEAVIMVVPAYKLREGHVLLVNESVLRDAEEVLPEGARVLRGRSVRGRSSGAGGGVGSSAGSGEGEDVSDKDAGGRAAPGGRVAPLWTPVDKFLPPDAGEVLATDQGTYYVASWDGSQWNEAFNDEPIDCHITHWMWLPEFPQEG